MLTQALVCSIKQINHVWLIQTSIFILHIGEHLICTTLNTSSATINIRTEVQMKQVYHQL